MKFKMQHRFLTIEPTFFEVDSPPSWLLHKDFNWWYEQYVKTLDVGQSIESDFQIITRVK